MHVTYAHTFAHMHTQRTTYRIGSYGYTFTTQKALYSEPICTWAIAHRCSDADKITSASQLCSLVCWCSITGASVREHARTQDRSCHVLIELLWNSKYPCLFVLVELHIHHNYVNWNPHPAFYKQLHCELEALRGRRGSG